MPGTVNYAYKEHVSTPRPSGNGGVKTITFTCVGDSSDGSIPDTTIDYNTFSQIEGWYLAKVHIVPGATAPLANSDVYIKDSDGIDLLDGNGENKLDATGAQAAYPQIDGQPALQPIVDPIVLDVDNQTNVSATYEIICFFVPMR